MATTGSGILGGLPLDEYTKGCPPGWKENMKQYPFRLYLEKLRLWNRMTDCDEVAKGATIVGRLKGKAYTSAMKLKITRAVQEPDAAGNPQWAAKTNFCSQHRQLQQSRT